MVICGALTVKAIDVADIASGNKVTAMNETAIFSKYAQNEKKIYYDIFLLVLASSSKTTLYAVSTLKICFC